MSQSNIEVTGIEETQDRLATLQRRVENMQPIMAEIGNMVTNEIDETFEDEGHPKWIPLSRTTLRLGYTNMGKSKAHTHNKDGKVTRGFERYMSDRKILQNSHRLRNSFVSESTMDSVTVGSNLPYVAIQHFGGMAGRGHKVKIPARMILPIDANGNLVPSLGQAILSYVEKKLDEAVE